MKQAFYKMEINGVMDIKNKKRMKGGVFKCLFFTAIFIFSRPVLGSVQKLSASHFESLDKIKLYLFKLNVRLFGKKYVPFCCACIGADI